MEYRNLKYFEEVAKLGNITKAANELKISQPPLSKQIKTLEDKLGYKLFIRHSKGMELTKKGSIFLKKIRPLLRQFEELSALINESKSAITHDITIATLPALTGLLSKSLKQIWKEHPELNITIREGHANSVVSMVNNRKAHIGITRLPILTENLSFSIIDNDPVRVFMAEDDKLINNVRVYPKDLTNRKLILLRLESQKSGFFEILRVLEEFDAKPIILGYSETISTMLQIVKQKAAIALVPKSSQELAPNGVVSIPFGKNDIYIPSAIIWLKNETNPFVFQMKKLLLEYCR